jgi:phosphatidate cytidylyltransferase
VLAWRITVGTALITLLVVLCWLDYRSAVPGVWLYPLALLLTCAASVELAGLIGVDSEKRIAPAICLGAVVVVAFSGVPIFWQPGGASQAVGHLGWPLLGVTLCVIAAMVHQIWRFQQPGRETLCVARFVFGVVFLGMLLGFAVLLRVVVPDPWGLIALVSLIAVVKLGDTGAFLVGRCLGRHRMAPRLSPGKTWEGAVGGLCFSCLGAYLVLDVLAQRLGDTSGASGWLGSSAWWVFGTTIGLAGMVGDLAVSLLKRNAGVKDSSRWLPGLGGVLDILDSILIAAPVAYVFWLVGAVGP